MAKLRPKSFELDVIYECPKCKDKHYYSNSELRSRPILMCCDEVFEIKPIHQVKVHFKFNNNIPDGAIKVLRQYGFTKQEIDDLGIEATSTEDFIRKFLASQE